MKVSPALIVSTGALILAGTGVAGAAATGLIGTSQIHNGAVTNLKLANGSVGTAKFNSNAKSYIATLVRANQPAAAVATPGAKGDTGATGATGARGATGAAGTNGTDGTNGRDGGPNPGESSQTCAPELCLDAAPGPDRYGNDQGSSGFGYDQTNNTVVTSVGVGQDAPFTVQALQPNDADISGNTRGQATITYDADYLTVDPASLPSNCVDRHSDSDTAAGWIVCDNINYTHTDQGISVTFTGKADTPYTQVNDAVTTGGETASQVVPIAVTG